jgi:hypothetical protein
MRPTIIRPAMTAIAVIACRLSRTPGFTPDHIVPPVLAVAHTLLRSEQSRTADFPGARLGGLWTQTG